MDRYFYEREGWTKKGDVWALIKGKVINNRWILVKQYIEIHECCSDLPVNFELERKLVSHSEITKEEYEVYEVLYC